MLTFKDCILIILASSAGIELNNLYHLIIEDIFSKKKTN